jgi:nucleotide-binding universal stress UspA family protein
MSARRILACVDLSAFSARVIDCARALAEPDGTLVILHVAAPDPEFVGYAAGPKSVRDAVAADLREEHRAVQSLADGVRSSGLTVTPLAVQGATTERIHEHAVRLDVDFVVIGSRSHGALHDLVVGSVVQGVLRGAATPVVVVPLPSTDARAHPDESEQDRR